MSEPRPTALEVYVDVVGETLHVGSARFRYRGAITTTEFAYASSYLADPRAYALDPTLPLSTTRVVVSGLPASLSDAAPDWWGEQLVARQLRLDASRDGRTAQPATEVDYLVGVSDLARQGSVRVALPGSQTFLDPEGAIPRSIELPALLAAADTVVADDDTGMAAALSRLLAAGSALLGGARPKASVVDDGRLTIAKFPHHQDEWDVMAWEKTVLDLAEECDIDVVARRRLVEIEGRQVLLLDRFDRDAEGGRTGYVSATTLAEAVRSTGHDYLDLVAAIEDHSAQASADLRALWLRVAFTVAMNNTDDHFNNHGFLRSSGGWRLAPAFDININPHLTQPRVTAMAGADTRAASLDALVRECAWFGLDADDARTGLVALADAIEPWRDVARSNGIDDAELDQVGWVLDDYREAVAGRR